MPRSFLVRLRPSTEIVTDHDSKTDRSRSIGKKQHYPEGAPPTRSATSIEIATTNTRLSTPESRPLLKKPSYTSQSNPTMVMMSHETNEPTGSYNYISPSSEIAMPTSRYPIVPYTSPWTQYDQQLSSHNKWYYPSHENLQLQKYSGKDVIYPSMYSEDISIHRTQLHNQRYQNEEQKLSDQSKFTTFRDFVRAEKTRGAENVGRDHLTVSETKELPPKKRPHSHNDLYEPVTLTKEKSAFIPLETSSSNVTKPESPQSSPEKMHTCSQCNKTFNRASNLRAHIKTHSENKPYKCDFCGKGFHQKIDKRIHHYTHTGEKPHKCKKCGRGFKQLTHLNYHMRTHSDTHMYHCTYCGKGFNQKGNLQAHIYGHTGQRPFKCDICLKGFTLRSTLNTHLRTHAPKKPFVCEYCSKAFYQKNALKMHHIASHPIVNGKSML